MAENGEGNDVRGKPRERESAPHAKEQQDRQIPAVTDLALQEHAIACFPNDTFVSACSLRSFKGQSLRHRALTIYHYSSNSYTLRSATGDYVASRQTGSKACTFVMHGNSRFDCTSKLETVAEADRLPQRSPLTIAVTVCPTDGWRFCERFCARHSLILAVPHKLTFEVLHSETRVGLLFAKPEGNAPRGSLHAEAD